MRELACDESTNQVGVDRACGRGHLAFVYLDATDGSLRPNVQVDRCAATDTREKEAAYRRIRSNAMLGRRLWIKTIHPSVEQTVGALDIQNVHDFFEITAKALTIFRVGSTHTIKRLCELG
jgi:hypothetical protein